MIKTRIRKKRNLFLFMYSSLLTPYADTCSVVEECSKYALIPYNTLVILINLIYLTDCIIIHTHAAASEI